MKLATTADKTRVLFHCPGCEEAHCVTVNGARNEVTNATWGWNQSLDKPTFTPSILVTGVKMTEKGIAQYEAWRASGMPQPVPTFENAPQRCHSFVTDGRIQFLNDCSHALAGKTV